MTILGWQLNTQSDANFHFVLGYQIVNFCILVVPFNKALFFLFFVVVANSGYFTVFIPHIYFIILISMIAGNLVEIGFPKIQSRKCLRKSISGDTAENVFGSLISTRLDRRSYQPTTCLNPRNFFPSTMFEIFSSVLAYCIFVLLLVVVFFIM